MIESALNTAIEIEGLLRILRDGNASPESVSLLKEKTASLSGIVDKLSLPLDSISSDPIPADLLSTDSDDILLSLEEDSVDMPEMGTSTKSSEPSTPGMGTSMKSSESLKSLFSLNDRFLFSRELFAGDMKMFDSTLKFIEGIRNFSDVEDYFYGDLEWDPENPVVASYLDILRPHFAD